MIGDRVCVWKAGGGNALGAVVRFIALVLPWEVLLPSGTQRWIFGRLVCDVGARSGVPRSLFCLLTP
jgi:hypothetical protein